MSRKDILNDEFACITKEELEQSNDIANALALINQEGCLSTDPIEEKKFIVAKNENLKQLSTKASLEEKTDNDLEEIANQADQAFYDLMDISVNTVGKACAEIANAANSFLNIKLNAKIAKMDAKYKKLNYELQLKKLEASSKKNNSNEDDDDDDDVIIVTK